ncbi:hypothetical protein BCR32DRAFT_250872 [Anaeromyces robustus]|uniref:Uncharacterized protein n=1 Tax=Anaeromyces robustus TaxID=1754192 RepID=A0A1Y1VV46_9FUNG|nr:hypothetical protein BCR32DRAFT_250872 [Anaeromyces robustus]|eukprot:ORX64885.1 hypothetical protein BCR32DRAFT_250872 [Anaeromyces robustus]
MESKEDQNANDLQIQNLSDDEDLYHQGVDYSNKDEETKPVTIKNTNQNSLSEMDQESIDTSDYVVTKEKIFEKTTTVRKIIRRNIPTESEIETSTETEDNMTSALNDDDEKSKPKNEDNKTSTGQDNDESILNNTKDGTKEETSNNCDNPDNNNIEEQKSIGIDLTEKNNDNEEKSDNINEETNGNDKDKNEDEQTNREIKSDNEGEEKLEGETNKDEVNDGEITNKNENGQNDNKYTTDKYKRVSSAPASEKSILRQSKYNEDNSRKKWIKDKKCGNNKDLNDAEFEEELKKREALSFKNAKKNANIGKDSENKNELDEIETERKRIIGDISVNSTDDEKEKETEEKGKKEKKKKYHSERKPHNTNIPQSSCSKKTKGSSRATTAATSTSTTTTSTATSKKKGSNKKSLKNNYRAFVSIKPSCNRYMANMWNNYIYSIHKMNILNMKKTVDNDAPKKYVHIDQKLKAKQKKKERDDEIRKNNQNILNRMIYQGRNNVGTSNLDDNNDVIEPVFRSLHAEKNKRLENEMNRESMTLLKRLKEKKPYCSVEQWKKERLVNEVYLRNISTYPENYPIRKKSQPKHVPPIKKNENEELRREKSPLEKTEEIYCGKSKMNRNKRNGPSTSSTSKSQKKHNSEKNRMVQSTANKENNDATEINTNTTVRVKKAKHRTLSESTRQSVKLYADTSINQNQADRLYLEQKNNTKYKIPETNTTTAFDQVLNNYEKVENDTKEEDDIVNKTSNSANIDTIKDIINDINEVSNDINKHHQEENQNNTSSPPVEEIPITEIENK